MARGARRNGQGSGGAWWRGFGVGLGAGVLLCVGLYFTRGPGTWGPAQQQEAASPPPPGNTAGAGPAPEFSFFTVLPDQEVPVPEEALGERAQAPASAGIRVLTGEVAPVRPQGAPPVPPAAALPGPLAAAPPVPPAGPGAPTPQLATRTPQALAPPLAPPAAPSPRGGYLLQAGSFRSPADAERVRAELALKGLRADVQAVTVNGTTFHRVRVGPYPDLDSLAGPRETLRTAGMPSLVVKLRAE